MAANNTNGRDTRGGGRRPPAPAPGSNPPPKKPPKGRHPQAGSGKANRHRHEMIDTAVTNLQNALLSRGNFTPSQALTFAKILLTRPGVTIGKTGIRYQGTRYDPTDFAKSPLADFVTGLKAQADNQAVIQGDPGYLADLANLGLTRDQSTAGLQDQYDRAVLDFGNAGFAGQNSILAGQASRNPFSTEALLTRAYQAQQAQAAADAALRGTAGGGGYQAAQQQGQRAYAGAYTGQVQSLQDLLANIQQQRAMAAQAYQVGQTNALQAAQQRLLASGQIHAATAPTLGLGKFRLYKPPRQPRATGRTPPPPPSKLGGGGGPGRARMGGGTGRIPHRGGLAPPPPPRY